jgi:hypothetical protein
LFGATTFFFKAGAFLYVAGIISVECVPWDYVFYCCFSDFNLAYLQRHGFSTPLLFRDKVGLGLRVPSPNFSVNDVRMCVGECFYVVSASEVLAGVSFLSAVNHLCQLQAHGESWM